MMNSQTIEDLNKLSLSEITHEKLKRLLEQGYFLEMRDAYRLGISLALSRGIRPPEILPPKSNGIYSISQIDPDRSIAFDIEILMDTENLPPYRWLERLAEWGIDELFRQSENGQLDILKILDDAQSPSIGT